MTAFLTLLLGLFFLILGIPIGTFLANQTKEELDSGQPWFKIIVLLSLIGAIASVFYESDPLLFSFLFIAVVTSRSLKKR